MIIRKLNCITTLYAWTDCCVTIRSFDKKGKTELYKEIIWVWSPAIPKVTNVDYRACIIVKALISHLTYLCWFTFLKSLSYQTKGNRPEIIISAQPLIH